MALRVAVLGQGSIGRRHAGILRDLGCEVVAFDPAREAPELDGIARASSAEEAVAAVDAVVVASPTSVHAEQAALAAEAGCALLVEKPVGMTAAAGREVADHAERHGVLLAVAMNLRFHPGPRSVRELIAGGTIGQPLWARFTFGYHLPDWRAGVDYRLSYSARSELGGGVLLDAVHEVDLATWLFGPARDVSAWIGQVSQLDIDVEDLALLRIGLAGGAVAAIELDYLDRSYRRGCRVVGSEASVIWDWSDESVRVLSDSGEIERRAAPADVAPTYREEIERFVRAVADRRTDLEGTQLVSGHEGVRALELIDAARESARSGQLVTLG